MSWSFNALEPALEVDQNGTFIKFAAQNTQPDMSAEVHIIGSGLTFDDKTGTMGGTITSLVLYDTNLSAPLQTVKLDAALSGTLAQSVTTFLAQSSQFKTDTIIAWDLFNGLGADHPGDGVFSTDGTKLTVDLLDVNDVVVAKMLFTGKGFSENNPEALVSLTSVTHLDPDGNPVAEHTVTYAAGQMPVTAVSYFFGNNELIYDVLTQGNDTVTVNAPIGMSIDGGAGDDHFETKFGGQLDYHSATAGVTVNLGTGTATGGGGHDTWTPNTMAGASGSHFNDTLTGQAAFGDYLSGSDGNDKLFGLGGGDHLFGNGGKDILTGGMGRDFLEGGALRDVFDFNTKLESGKIASTRDVITDFRHLVDDVDLKGIDASSKKAGDQAFKFIDKQGFHHPAGELHIKFEDSNKTIVEGDINGDGRADFQIELSGHLNLTKADFIL